MKISSDFTHRFTTPSGPQGVHVLPFHLPTILTSFADHRPHPGHPAQSRQTAPERSNAPLFQTFRSRRAPSLPCMHLVGLSREDPETVYVRLSFLWSCVGSLERRF